MLAYDRYWDQVRRDKALIDDLDDAHAKLDAAVAKLRQTAHNLKAMNLSNEQIAAATGLTADEITAL